MMRILKMTVIRPTWKREVVMKAWALGLDYSLILITSPARDKGSAFLKRDKEIWNWRPFEPRRISWVFWKRTGIVSRDFDIVVVSTVLGESSMAPGILSHQHLNYGLIFGAPLNVVEVHFHSYDALVPFPQ